MQPNDDPAAPSSSAHAQGVTTDHVEQVYAHSESGVAAQPTSLEEVAARQLDDTLQHVESVGRPHDLWWALNNRRKALAERIFGREACAICDAFLTSSRWLIFTVVLTLFCLYAVDICDVSACSEQARTTISGLLLVIFVLFSLEVIASAIFVDRYFLSFFFWVDLIGTVSLVFDIQWIADSLLSEGDSNALQISRAGRAARLGSQIGRITRVLRIVRLFRALRLLKVFQLSRRSEQGMQAHGLGNGPIRPTVLGELLAESTTRKCVVIILIVLIVATFLETSPPDVADYNRLQLLSYGVMSPEAFVQHAAYPVIALSYVDAASGSLVPYLPLQGRPLRPDLRLHTSLECVRYVGPELRPCGFAEDWSTVWYDVTRTVRLNAGLNIVLTSIIIFCLGLSAYFFGKDATTYVIVPIETMLKYLRRIMVGGDGDAESEGLMFAKPPETDVLANYVARLVDEINHARCQAEQEAVIADTLLCSMVPHRIARQLKELRWWEAGPEQRAQTIADSFPNVTVLFTDLVGFTTLSSRISAEDAMRHLNNMYTVFDDIVERYGLYKVETIGDSYMLVGGAPEERPDHAERVARAALEMRACVPLLQEISGEPEINVRIGMHSGAVTAGVVGFKNPRWHLFGDTCNTASRMESTGVAGEVQLSCTTYELIKEHFACKLRGRIAVKGKGEMVTYLLEREYGGPNKRPDSPNGHGSQYPSVSGAAGPSGGPPMDREAFLASPQFKKAMERYATARNSALHEEEELVKLLKSLDEATAAAAAAAAGLASSGGATGGTGGEGGEGGGTGPGTGLVSAAEAVTAAGCVVPRLAAGLGGTAFKSLVLGGAATQSDLKALAVHLHEELGVARALLGSAEEERAAAGRREVLLRLYGRVLEAPGMSLRDTFTAILDTLYKVLECDVIKLYVVDHTRGQLWPASRHSAADATRTLPLDGTLAGSAVRRACAVRVDNVAAAPEFNAELEELPAGYVSKSMMCVPVFSSGHTHATSLRHLRLAGGAADGASGGGGTSGGESAASTPGPAHAPGDVIAVIVAVNRWTSWGEAGAEEGERRIVPFSAADEASVRDAAGSVGLLLQRRRGEMLLAAAAGAAAAAAAGLGGGAGLGGLGFSVAALPASVARQRLRSVARRGSGVLLDLRGNLWALKQEELMGQARDVLAALQRHCSPEPRALSDASSPTGSGGGAPGGWWSWPGDEVLVSYLVRIAGEQSGGQFFNLAHSVGVMQGIYLTLRSHPELAAALGPLALLSLVLAASLLNVIREGEAISAGGGQPPPSAAGAGTLGGGGGGVAGRGGRSRASGAGPGLITSGSVQIGAGASGVSPTAASAAVGSLLQSRGSGRTAVLSVPNGAAQHQSAAVDAASAARPGSGSAHGSVPAPAAPPPLPAAAPSTRGRGMSVRRCRLAAVVDDILSGESNLLSGFSYSDAATVKAGVVALLAVRNQPSGVLNMPGLQPSKVEVMAAAAAAAASVAPSVGTVTSEAASNRTSLAEGSISGVRAEGEASAGGDAGADVVKAEDVNVTVAEEPAAAGAGASVGEDGSPSLAVRSASPASLQALMQAAGSDPTALAEARNAVSALLLLTWSELHHVKDTSTALSLLLCRAQDVNAWANRAAATVNSRKRASALMGATQTLGDVQDLLLLEVPRMQLEVIPLWQRTVELLPGLQTQLEAAQANRAAYMAMLQNTATPGGGAPGGLALGASGAIAAGGTLALRSGSGGTSQRGSGGSGRSSLQRGGTTMGGGLVGGPAPLRRFISVKYRGSANARGGVLGVMTSGDSIDEGSGSVVGGGRGGRVFTRASSSRSYAGRTTVEDEEAEASSGAEGRGGTSGSGAEGVGSAAGVPHVSIGPRRGGSPAARLLSGRRGASHSPGSTGALSGLPEGDAPGTSGGSRTSGSVGGGAAATNGRPGSLAVVRLSPAPLGAAGDAETSPTATSLGLEGSGQQRRSSRPNRFNYLLSAMSFRASGRFTGRHHPAPGSAGEGPSPAGTGTPNTPAASNSAYGYVPFASAAGAAALASPQRLQSPPPPGGVALELQQAGSIDMGGRCELQTARSAGGPMPYSPRGGGGGGGFGALLAALPSRRRSAGGAVGVPTAAGSRPGSQALAPPLTATWDGTIVAAPAAAPPPQTVLGTGPAPDGLPSAPSTRKRGPKMGLLKRISTLTARLPFGGDRIGGGSGPTASPGGGPVSHTSTPIRSSPAVSEGGAGALPADHTHSPASPTPQPFYRAGPPPPPHTRSSAPSAALALAREHEQRLAEAAQAAAAIAAANAAAAAAEVSRERNTGGRARLVGGSGRSSAPDLDSLPSGSALSLAGGMGAGLMHGAALAPVAELTNSGRGSSALGTPRSGSAATYRTTSSDPPSLAMGFPRGPPGTLSAGGASAAASAVGSPTAAPAPISRFGRPLPASPLQPSPLSPVSPALQPPGTLQLREGSIGVPSRGGSIGGLPDLGLPQRAMYLADGSMAPVLSNAAAGAAAGAVAIVVPPRMVTEPSAPDLQPAKLSTSARAKGMWLGLRLATDALRSVSRGADSGNADLSSSGHDVQLGGPEVESPSLPGPPPQVANSRWPSLNSAGGVSGIMSSGAVPGSSAGSRNPSRIATPVASWRRGAVTAAGLPASAGGAPSIQAVIDMAEAALAGGGGGMASHSGSRERRTSLGGSGFGAVGHGAPSTSSSRNQSLRRSPATALMAATVVNAAAGTSPVPRGASAEAASPSTLQSFQKQLESEESQRTSAPPAPSRFSLRRSTGSIPRGSAAPVALPTLAQLPREDE